MSRKLRRCWTYIGGRWRSNGHAGMTLTIWLYVRRQQYSGKGHSYEERFHADRQAYPRR